MGAVLCEIRIKQAQTLAALEVKQSVLRGSPFLPWAAFFGCDTILCLARHDQPTFRGIAMNQVLIVEDDEDSRKVLARYMEKGGYKVRQVSGGKDALTEILAHPPDVMILDLMMPDMDGPSLLEVTRSYLRLHSLPVVVLTALEDGPLVDRVRSARVNAILIKSKAKLADIKAAVEHAVCQLPN
jgi:CheY-like chemotaxis protein